MIGLALAARRLAYARAEANDMVFGYTGPNDWTPLDRSHAARFKRCPTAEYYRIIDNITAGRRP